jgi:hypothetical protein
LGGKIDDHARRGIGATEENVAGHRFQPIATLVSHPAADSGWGRAPADAVIE